MGWDWDPVENLKWDGLGWACFSKKCVGWAWDVLVHRKLTWDGIGMGTFLWDKMGWDQLARKKNDID